MRIRGACTPVLSRKHLLQLVAATLAATILAVANAPAAQQHAAARCQLPASGKAARYPLLLLLHLLLLQGLQATGQGFDMQRASSTGGQVASDLASTSAIAHMATPTSSGPYFELIVVRTRGGALDLQPCPAKHCLCDMMTQQRLYWCGQRCEHTAVESA
jgi:hypothetical protein